MSDTVRLAIGQFATDPNDPDASRQRVLGVVAEAIAGGADVIVVPELAVPGYTADAELLARHSEPIDGPTISALTDLAADSGVVIVAGISERDGEQLFNSAVTVGPAGVLSVYRKLHLFADEKQVFAPGDRGLPVVETPHGRIGACICYDLRFVEVVRSMSLAGADIVAVPTAWLPGFDKQWWDADGMAPQAHGAVLQANLDQVFIACASAAGELGPYHFLGSSVVADPWGKRILGPLPGDRADLAFIDIDRAEVQRSQHRGPGIDPRDDRRSDVYGDLGVTIHHPS